MLPCFLACNMEIIMVIGGVLVRRAVKEFSQDRTKEVDVYRMHCKGAVLAGQQRRHCLLPGDGEGPQC